MSKLSKKQKFLITIFIVIFLLSGLGIFFITYANNQVGPIHWSFYRVIGTILLVFDYITIMVFPVFIPDDHHK